MAIWSTTDAYKHLKVGMYIGYYGRSPWGDVSEKDLEQGVITSLEECDTGPCDEPVCNTKIGIDGRRPTCFMYNSRTAIRYVRDRQFLLEEDFEL